MLQPGLECFVSLIDGSGPSDKIEEHVLLADNAGQQVGTGSGLVWVDRERVLASALRVEDDPAFRSSVHDHGVLEVSPEQVVRALPDTQVFEVSVEYFPAFGVRHITGHGADGRIYPRLGLDIRSSAGRSDHGLWGRFVLWSARDLGTRLLLL